MYITSCHINLVGCNVRFAAGTLLHVCHISVGNGNVLVLVGEERTVIRNIHLAAFAFYKILRGR